MKEVRDIVCSFNNLYKAMRKCKLSVSWKNSVSGYVGNGLSNIYTLKQNLDNETYKLDKYQQFTIFEPKVRNIVSTRFKDRVFQRSLCDNYLYKEITNSFINNNCACQLNKGTEYGRIKLKAALQKYYRKHNRSNDGWVLKIDLKNYFGSTTHSLAYNSIQKRVNDSWALKEIKRVIDSYNQGENPEIGMGLGSQLTQLIQLSVLDDLDHIIKEQLHIKYYVRYMDDLILIDKDKEKLLNCLDIIEKWINDRELTLNKKKTQLFKIKQGINFLGFKFRLTDTGKVIITLLPAKLSHERRKLKRLVNRAKQGYMTKADVDRCFKSWKAHINNQSNRKNKRVKRNCHNLLLSMDCFYKNLWKEC